MLTSLLALLAQTAPAPAPAVPPKSPAQIAEAAPAAEWVAIPARDLLVVDLAPGAGGRPRRVVIQLIAAPLSARHVANIRAFARAHWWDGTSVNRVQDNYVAQWGDATEKKPLPPGIATVAESEYETPWTALGGGGRGGSGHDPLTGHVSRGNGQDVQQPADVYAAGLLYYKGWPLGTDLKPAAEARSVWPVHCYGTVGVGRNMSPDTGSGAEMYAVIGHAPRHLDRNVAVVGRVVQGIEHLSSLPRGTGSLGFYETPAERVAIVSARLADELPAAERPRFEYLSTDGATFVDYANARRNRELPFFFKPAGAADVCNIPVPVRAAK